MKNGRPRADNILTPTLFNVSLYGFHFSQGLVYRWSWKSGPSCSKLTMSLVNDSLKFTSSDTQICWNFLLKKMWVACAVQKLLTCFLAKNIRILYIESAKTVKMTLNELVKLTTLWTTGPWALHDTRFDESTSLFSLLKCIKIHFMDMSGSVWSSHLSTWQYLYKIWY